MGWGYLVSPPRVLSGSFAFMVLQVLSLPSAMVTASTIATTSDSCRTFFDLSSKAGLFLISGLLAFSPLLEGGTTHLAAMIIRLLILVGLSLYWIRTIKTGILLCPRMRIGHALLAFLGLAAASTLWAPYTNQSQQWIMVLLGYAGLLYLLAAFVKRWEDVAKLCAVLIVMALGEATWALTQTYRFGAARPTGTFFNPNFLAGYLATISMFVLSAACYVRLHCRQSWPGWRALIRLLLPLAILSILLVAVVLTGSRGGALALIVGAAFVIGLRFGRRGVIGLLVVLFLGCLAPNPIRDRVIAEHGGNPETYARLQMWQSAMHEMIEHPLGVGLGLYQYTYPQYAFPVEGEIIRYGKIAQTPHNEYLQMGVELGGAGLGMFLWGLVLVVCEAVWLLRQRLTRRQRSLLVGACAGIVVILTQAAVDSNLHEPALAILLTFCMGIVMVGRKLCTLHASRLRLAVAIKRPLLWAVMGAVVIGLLAANVLRLGIAYQIYDSGTRLARQQQFEQAIGNFKWAILLDPGKALYHNSLAAAYFQLHQRTHEEAMAQASLEELRRAITLNPLDGRLQSLLGFVSASQVSSHRPADMTEQDRLWLGQAVDAYERAAGLEPFAYAHRFELARLALALGQIEVAEQHLKKVIELEPNFLPGRQLLVRLYVESGRQAEAKHEYQEIVARQQRYGDRATTAIERSFLQVDATKLAGLLEQFS